MIGSLLAGDLSSKRLSFSRLRDLLRPEAALVPAAIIASGAFRRDPLEIRRVAAGEQFNPEVGDITDTATAQNFIKLTGSLNISSYAFYINITFNANTLIIVITSLRKE
jgi:hypothetical protein